MTNNTHPEPFGMANVSSDLAVSKRFYANLFPFETKHDTFAGIKFFSVMKDGETLVTVFERSDANPIKGSVPVLKVESVTSHAERVRAAGGEIIIPMTTCPCTNANFSLCADAEGNQFILKEPAR